MKLTVFMPVYNREKYLKYSIGSILKQDYTDFELLIIDDGSTDNSISIIESFKDSRIRLLKNETNKGVVFTRNRGMEEARGEFILLLDSDDIAIPGRFRKQVNWMESKQDAVIIYSSMIANYSNGVKKSVPIIEDNELIKAMMIFKNCVMTSASIIRRSKIIENGVKYRQEYFYGEDYAFAIDALKYGEIYGINEALTSYTCASEGSITSTVHTRREEVTNNIMFFIRKKYLEDNDIYLNDEQIMIICKATAQPTLIDEEQFKLFISTLEEININNKSFNNEKLRISLEQITNEILYFSQKIKLKEKKYIIKNTNISYITKKLSIKKLVIYHLKFNIKKLINKL
ncbi:glycosyltransferase family 2 protein [Clostridium celatum]|uniref:glycosyltransferase family 2 protein n=1 Tax=Clostridium celatum TaxID=36834 RepID=UPI001899D57A|nr:glycosyltransferase family A protein [Clostridium celatum]